MRHVLPVVSVFALVAGCGSTALQGTAAWVGAPRVSPHSLSGDIRNTTSHSLSLNARSMRLLDDRGRRVSGRIQVGSESVPAHGTTSLRASWKTGKPVRIDYGEGTLALPSD